MRLAVVLPSQGVRMGGVQRFGMEIADALDDLVDVRRFRVHPPPGGPRARALARGIAAILREHRADRFDALVSTFHWPPRLPGIPTYGVVHDVRDEAGGSWHPGRVLVHRAIARSWPVAMVPTAHVGRDVVHRFGPIETRVIGEGLDHLDRFSEPTGVVRDLLVVLGGRVARKRTDLGLDSALRAGQALGVRPLLLGGSLGDVPTGVDLVADPTDNVVAATLARARVVVAATAYEGFGLAVGEALRAGAPVVYASDAPLADLVGGGGLAAPPEPVAMSEAVAAAWTRSAELSSQARDSVAGLTWHQTAVNVLRVIAET